MTDDRKGCVGGSRGTESKMALRDPVPRPPIDSTINRPVCQKLPSRDAQDRRKAFSSSQSRSFDNGDGNAFQKGSFDQDKVLSQLNNSASADEGISSMDMCGPESLEKLTFYKHSVSAPSGSHEPLTKASYDQGKSDQSKLCTAKSMVETRRPSKDGINQTSPAIYRSTSDSKERRQSYKDSAYGGSEGSKGDNSSRGSTDAPSSTQPSDDVFEPSWPRRNSLKFKSLVSQNSELDTLPEDQEEVSVSSCSGSTGTCATMQSQGTPTVLEEDNNSPTPRPHSQLCRQQTPDFDALCPRSVSGSTSSESQSSEKSPPSPKKHPSPTQTRFFPSENNPVKSDIEIVAKEGETDRTGSRPLLETTGEVGLTIGCPPRSSLSEDDVVFTEHLSSSKRSTDTETIEIQSLESAQPLSPKNGRVGRAWENWILPLDLSPLPSITSLDTSHKTEAELRSMYRSCRQWFHNSFIRQKIRRGEEPPEKIAALIQRIYSDSDRSSLSEFSSLSSGTTSVSTGSSGGVGDLLSPHIPTHLPAGQQRRSRDITDLRAQDPLSYGSGHQSGQEEEGLGLTLEAEELLAQLERYAGCRQTSCSDTDCRQGHRLMRYIEKYLEHSSMHSPCHDNFVLRTIAEHANLCDEINCPIPFCMFFHENDVPFEEQVACLQTTYFSGYISFTSEDSERNDVENLTNSPDVECTEHVHWKGIVRLGSYGKAVLAVTSSLENPAFWVVKKESKDLLLHASALRRLKKKSHPRIVQHLWILEQEDSIFYASKFEGASVADRLNETGRPGLSPDRARTYIGQLASAAQFLHRNNINIAYLNWTAENVLLSTNMKFVKLCNFSCAVPIDEICDDEERLEDLKFLLPARIVPPELYAGENVVPDSDVWGLGCLWYHMLTGHMVYPEYRHDNPASVRDKLEEGEEPDISEILDAEVTEILAKCFQTDPSERIPTAELYRTIVLLNQENKNEQ